MSCSCVVKGLGAVGGSLKSRAPAGRATQPSRVVTFHRVLNFKECYCEYFSMFRIKGGTFSVVWQCWTDCRSTGH